MYDMYKVYACDICIWCIFMYKVYVLMKYVSAHSCVNTCMCVSVVTRVWRSEDNTEYLCLLSALFATGYYTLGCMEHNCSRSLLFLPPTVYRSTSIADALMLTYVDLWGFKLRPSSSQRMFFILYCWPFHTWGNGDWLAHVLDVWRAFESYCLSSTLNWSN